MLRGVVGRVVGLPGALPEQRVLGLLPLFATTPHPPGLEAREDRRHGDVPAVALAQPVHHPGLASAVASTAGRGAPVRALVLRGAARRGTVATRAAPATRGRTAPATAPQLGRAAGQLPASVQVVTPAGAVVLAPVRCN